MKKIILFSISLLGCMVMLNAKPVPQATCEAVAKNFYTITTGHTVSTTDVEYTAFDKNNVPLYFVFNINANQNQDKGFVIIAADDAVYPILGYGNQNKPYSIPSNKGGAANVAFWMKARSNDISQVRTLNIAADPLITAQWKSYSDSQADVTHQAQKNINSQFPSSSNFLVQSQWDQSTGWEIPDPYSYYCPYSSITGCVATAMAQIMRYWNWPSYGVGASCDSMSDYANVTICDNYFHNYDWNDMTLVSPPAGDTSIAKLMYDVGISVGMEYSQQGSDAMVIDSDAIDSIIWKKMDTASAQNALIKYFRYNKATIKGLYAIDYSDSNWIYKLKGELDSNMPINYAGYTSDSLDGHSWVCDGYDINFNFHFNFGWGGYDDGWYALTDLSPGYAGITFNTIMEGLMGIRPDTTISTSVYSIQPVTNTVTVYPNPSNGVFQLGIRNYKLGINNSVEVYNTLGENIYNATLKQVQGDNRIDLSSQPNGVYFLRIVTEDGILISEQKIVKLN